MGSKTRLNFSNIDIQLITCISVTYGTQCQIKEILYCGKKNR